MFDTYRFSFWVHKEGENAAHFSPGMFHANRLVIFAQGRRKCCPFFSKSFLTQIGIPFLGGRGFKTGGSAAPFFSKSFDFAFFVQDKAKCCPFFSNNSSAPFDFLLFVQRQGELTAAHLHLNNCSSKSTSFGFKTSGNAAHFSPRMLHPNGLCRSFTTGKCCPFFSRKISMQIDFYLGFHKRGENAAHFSPGILHANRFCSRRRRCCPFFSKSFLTQIDFPFWGIRGVQNRRKCCPFFSKSFGFALFVQKKAKCCPFFSDNSSAPSTSTFMFEGRGKLLPIFLP